MPLADALRPICLERPPQILSMSTSHRHGLRKVERYRLDGFWCLNLFRGEGELSIAGKSYPFRSGYAGITWPGVDLIYSFKTRTTKTWAHFIPAQAGEQALCQIPVMQDLGADFLQVQAELQAIASLYRAQPGRALARLWSTLWRLVPGPESQPGSAANRHPLVTRAMDEIGRRLSEAIGLQALAAELEISQTHLNRLFRAATGNSAGRYIRERRLETACHLLRNTTMSIKQIASHVGVPDPQHFNKLVRHRYGLSPTQLREAGGRS